MPSGLQRFIRVHLDCQLSWSVPLISRFAVSSILLESGGKMRRTAITVSVQDVQEVAGLVCRGA